MIGTYKVKNACLSIPEFEYVLLFLIIWIKEEVVGWSEIFRVCV